MRYSEFIKKILSADSFVYLINGERCKKRNIAQITDYEIKLNRKGIIYTESVSIDEFGKFLFLHPAHASLDIENTKETYCYYLLNRTKEVKHAISSSRYRTLIEMREKIVEKKKRNEKKKTEVKETQPEEACRKEGNAEPIKRGKLHGELYEFTAIYRAFNYLHKNTSKEDTCRLCDDYINICDYSRKDSRAIYTMRYHYAYYHEAYDVIRKWVSIRNDVINALSLGCGNCPDYFALRNVAESKCKKYKYIGIDSAPWEQDSFELDNSVKLIDSIDALNEEKFDIQINLIIFSKSLRNITPHLAKEYLDRVAFCEELILICMNAGTREGEDACEEQYNKEIVSYIKDRQGCDYSEKHTYNKDTFTRETLPDIRDIYELYEQYCDNRCGKAKEEEGLTYYKCNPVSRRTLYNGEIYIWRDHDH